MKYNIILFKNKKNNEIVKLVNKNLKAYQNNLLVLKKAEQQNKCEIIYNEINASLTEQELNKVVE